MVSQTSTIKGITNIHTGLTPRNLSEEYELQGLAASQSSLIHDGASEGTKDTGSGEPLRIFWGRTLCCILVPPLLTIYYALIWHYWLQSYDYDSPVSHGTKGARWVYYSWFILSAVGINLSKYGLAGVEAGMLMNRRWAARNAMQLTMHCDKTWSGPSGWIKIALISIRSRSKIRPSTTWIVLAIVSLLPFIALPLSGLTLELSEGFKPGVDVIDRAELSGQNQNTFADQALDVIDRAFNRWRYPSNLQLSRRSAFYVPEVTAPLQNKTWLKNIPNNWPDDDKSTVFLAPQSDRPVLGPVWGLQATYDCTIITHVEQFQLLSQRSADRSRPRCPAIDFASYNGEPQYYGLPELCDHDVYMIGQRSGPADTSLDLVSLANVGFLDGSMEMALKYERKEHDEFSDTTPVLLEMAVWQTSVKLETPCEVLEKEVSNDLSVVVEGMQKPYLDHHMYEREKPPDSSPILLDAIGVQCNSSFILGTATLDGLKGTYASFTREEPVSSATATSVPLATAVPEILRSSTAAALDLREGFSLDAVEKLVNQLNISNDTFGQPSTNPIPEIASNASWLPNLFKSVGAYNLIPIPCDSEGNPIDLSSSPGSQQLNVITSAQLKKSIIRAHQAYAIELSGPRGGLWQGNLTNAVPTPVIVPGKLSPVAIICLLAVWAVSCSLLGSIFSTRRRWADILDGFSMFRFGADNPEFAAGGNCVKDYDQCLNLLHIPGLVGDSEPGTSPGHIALVKDVMALPEKEYRGPSSCLYDDEVGVVRRKGRGKKLEIRARNGALYGSKN